MKIYKEKINYIDKASGVEKSFYSLYTLVSINGVDYKVSLTAKCDRIIYSILINEVKEK